ncbi:uncharacterized protein TRIADDRAFT_50846 [Trichoplax adhaerens]|uniref:Glycosyl transferase 64 domain-containing protein n=1 Tax=Trichoplax adhaerens TaxID=10228 RepID=B3S7R7_TRIAD|nr:hypothetical protein TRIADDRAFT_50846 [Trichoplax adhaerens]EDV21339.1 hypothetical protein TRIADDRAFT_50846 [Trichoplax adhaerens]|eukprot:XP_002116306.1 hypothetical protein TRIADDRAFT_50846 [Trichoplax adhaerens]
MTAVLMAISNSDILKKRSHCQFIYHTYFSNSENQFTIIILTHNRPNILRQRLINLSRLLYLNKIIVVWNEYNKYAKHFQWPHSDIPIYVFKSKRNSLNDRFFPFNAVETEAVLSLDDDVDLNADEIDFAFRVWRESRDRIVGFPARHHTWSKLTNRWSYDSNKTCQLSMVLTGAAFIHKYYLFLYTFTMPEGIRRRVDEIMNCEDIAMNFLISHITGKPPIKVTSRWNFNCPTCETTLTRDVNHFKKRNSCVNYFAQIYGYMPLIFSQFRVDSILYRTRVPNGEQKCYESQL